MMDTVAMNSKASPKTHRTFGENVGRNFEANPGNHQTRADISVNVFPVKDL
jgi:hypothetical protein